MYMLSKVDSKLCHILYLFAILQNNNLESHEKGIESQIGFRV